MRGIRSVIGDRITVAMKVMGAPEGADAMVVPASRPEFETIR